MIQKLIDTDQFKSGNNVAQYLDRLFGTKNDIRLTTPHEERVLCLGDRVFTRKADGRIFYIEYKSGLQTVHTLNIFLETVSVDTPCKPGWVYTCQASFIFYAALLNGKILLFRPDKLRAEIADLKTKFKEVKTGKGQSEGYNTHGVIVPLEYAEVHLAERVIEIAA